MYTLDRMPRDSELAMVGDNLSERGAEALRLWWKDARLFCALTALCALPLGVALFIGGPVVQGVLAAFAGAATAVSVVVLSAPTVCRRRRGLTHGLDHTLQTILRRTPAAMLAGLPILAAVATPSIIGVVALKDPVGLSLGGLIVSAVALLSTWIVAARLALMAPALVAEDLPLRGAAHRSLVMTKARPWAAMPALALAAGVVAAVTFAPMVLPVALVGLSLASVALACTYMWLRGD